MKTQNDAGVPFRAKRKMNASGVTIVELIIVATLAILLSTYILGHFDPVRQNAKARDNKRLSDSEYLDRALNEYMLNNGAYPGAAGQLRLSTQLPLGNSGPLDSPQQGWIDADMSANTTRLPLDPRNDDSYFYSYMHSSTGYELNIRLEALLDYSADDGGDDPDVYEIGNDLSII